MKRILSIILVTVLSLSLLASCSQSGNGNDKKIVIGATPTPHGEILKVVKEVLAEKGYELEIRNLPNMPCSIPV